MARLPRVQGHACTCALRHLPRSTLRCSRGEAGWGGGFEGDPPAHAQRASPKLRRFRAHGRGFRGQQRAHGYEWWEGGTPPIMAVSCQASHPERRGRAPRNRGGGAVHLPPGVGPGPSRDRGKAALAAAGAAVRGFDVITPARGHRGRRKSRGGHGGRSPNFLSSDAAMPGGGRGGSYLPPGLCEKSRARSQPWRGGDPRPQPRARRRQRPGSPRPAPGAPAARPRSAAAPSP